VFAVPRVERDGDCAALTHGKYKFRETTSAALGSSVDVSVQLIYSREDGKNKPWLRLGHWSFRVRPRIVSALTTLQPPSFVPLDVTARFSDDIDDALVVARQLVRF
jgi:hypothetical protein